MTEEEIKEIKTEAKRRFVLGLLPRFEIGERYYGGEVREMILNHLKIDTNRENMAVWKVTKATDSQFCKAMLAPGEDSTYEVISQVKDGRTISIETYVNAVDANTAIYAAERVFRRNGE